MTPTRICGHLLLWIGFLSGAFVTVRQVEVEEAPWTTIAWPAYAAALSLAVVGVVLLRTTRPGARPKAEHAKPGSPELAAILASIEATLRAWNESAEPVDVYDYHGMIDDQLAENLGRFADLRETLIPEFGLDAYARIMTEFALAERTINRVWSASADGYVDEVRTCLDRAARHIAAARERLEEAKAARLA